MFGDGVFGKKIEEPNFVEVSYIVSNGAEQMDSIISVFLVD